MTGEAFAPAKINLTLHVTGRRADGYHLLDSLVAFADIGDRVRVGAGRGVSLSIDGPMARGVPTDDGNLVLQAARFAGATDVALNLEKHLPAAAGIGGGSSDAAATLRALSWFTGKDLPENTELLGADVPVCLAARTTRMQGAGEILTPVEGFPRLWAILANPGRSVPTPRVFQALRNRNGSAMPEELPQFLSAREAILWLAGMRNDLEEAAIEIQPAIADVLRTLSALPGVHLARMSGSGATCFALFDEQGLAEIHARELEQTRPDWWVRACLLG